MKCERCNKEHDGKYGSGRFCSRTCANARKHTEETKKRIGESLRKRQKEKSKKVKDKKEVKNICELSSRTITKVFNRLVKYENLGCSICGWNQSTCDLHHIRGRKIKDANNHKNLCYLCPNCHRLVHTNRIKKEELVSILEQIGDLWKEYYYA